MRLPQVERICQNCGDEPKPLSCGPIENDGELIENCPRQEIQRKTIGWSDADRIVLR
jgi:hypothetical protein